jgi:hypothetical protein
MDMQAKNVGRCQWLLPPGGLCPSMASSYRSRLAVATYYIDENGRDYAITRIESVKSLYGIEKQSK